MGIEPGARLIGCRTGPRAAELWNQGLSVSIIAQRLGKSKANIHNTLRHMLPGRSVGIPRRREQYELPGAGMTRRTMPRNDPDGDGNR